MNKNLILVLFLLAIQMQLFSQSQDQKAQHFYYYGDDKDKLEKYQGKEYRMTIPNHGELGKSLNDGEVLTPESLPPPKSSGMPNSSDNPSNFSDKMPKLNPPTHFQMPIKRPDPKFNKPTY